MSLISLTFGSENPPTYSGHMSVSSPLDRLKARAFGINKLEVKKTCQFFGENEVFIIGEVISGCISKCMKGKLGGKTFEVVGFECKYPRATKAKKGMNIGLTVSGIEKEDLKAGDLIDFC